MIENGVGYVGEPEGVFEFYSVSRPGPAHQREIIRHPLPVEIFPEEPPLKNFPTIGAARKIPRRRARHRGPARAGKRWRGYKIPALFFLPIFMAENFQFSLEFPNFRIGKFFARFEILDHAPTITGNFKFSRKISGAGEFFAAGKFHEIARWLENLRIGKRLFGKFQISEKFLQEIH